ncbi:copper amine oxidase N-terminal domain-containing protein [Paenibacillus bouchesdurhonensis]|uniref:copper amine oxidase N-terminal domain-containing protein n=1 Tax=Paenibacillus bouchesdurhonensis TaxID=1870990 RepID=UPI000DA61DD7|nr:copper amine oxidase N-terminal domain-containing protein [Paenibacillus bouchesdurhonensis]
MRKLWITILSALLIFPLVLQTQAHAAQAISIYINGVRLPTDQAPILVSGRAMLPLRAIFEALDAEVDWNNKTKTVTAWKDGTSVVLKINSKTATIDNQTVGLDVPAQNVKGRTMVPVRFVSEALGEEVVWDANSKTVYVTTNTTPVAAEPVGYVSARDIANNGDGRDLQVSFSRASNQSSIDHYRVFIVKTNKTSSFNLATALKVPSANYTSVSVGSVDPTVTLTSQSRDVDGDLIKANQAYVAYVVSVGKGSLASALSYPSAAITLGTSHSVEAATNVRVSDVSDYGDGRDLYVTFTKPSKDSDISSYRIFVVKTKDAGKFDLAAANKLSSQYYTVVNKTSNSTLTAALSSSARDTSGDYIKNGVSYTVFVQSVSNNTATASHKLSAASSSITLNSGSVAAPVITQVIDESDYGDGRDLRISFTRLSDESRISGYRVFVVKANDYGSFNLAKANNVSSANYTEWSKDGYNFNRNLPSGARDVDGATIRNGVSYRVFVMAVGNGAYAGNNALSNPSYAITLLNNYSVGTISNLSVSDVSDYNDGRDLLVSFNRASDESNLSHYRVLVVKASNADSFNLAKANNVNSSNYTQINKGSNSYVQQALSSGARDVDGAAIRNGVSYRVFILSVGGGSYSGSNTLSKASSTITLSNNYSVGAVNGLDVRDVSDYNDGRDLQVSFNRASDESNISHYRIFVVKAANASSFNASKAIRVSSRDYTRVDKAGSYLSQTLPSSARDVDGAAIRNGVSYRVFVLSVGYDGSVSQNALSSQSAAITLSGNSAVAAVSNLTATVNGNNGDGRDIVVSFTRSATEDNIAEHRILVVPTSQGFGKEEANGVRSANYTAVAAGRDVSQALTAATRDVNGNVLKTGETYRVFVLSVSKSNTASLNALAGPSGELRLTVVDPVAPAASGVSAWADSNAASLIVSFTKPANENGVSSYAVLLVPAGEGMTESRASGLGTGAYKTVSKGGTPIVTFTEADLDASGNPIMAGVTYQVYVLSIADGTNATVNRLSDPSNSVVLVSSNPLEAR